ncbi:MAG: MFS transporter [Bacteroidota bacterium]|nr:MFS transporter [Bacteroidota bacterium]
MYNKKLVFSSACLGMLLFGIALISLGSLAPGLREKLQLSEIKWGAMFSVLPFGVLIGSLFFGPIVDRFGYKILLSLSCILLAAGFGGIAFTSDEGLLKLYILLIGTGGGSVNGATNALVSDISGRDKGANLSLLGVFFGIGALGMPLILGILKKTFGFDEIIAAVGVLSFITAIFFALIKLPPPKQIQGFPLTKGLVFIKDKILLLIAFFLFFQSSFEGIINNWTTSYLISKDPSQESNALYSLSLFVAGMAIMRLLTGSVLRNIPARRILTVSFVLILLGLILIKAKIPSNSEMTGLFILGAGLAGGFPIMLGFVGEMYAEFSGTAFSFVLFIALIGNMLVNYLMGIISQNFGISHLITVAFTEAVVMIILWFIILRNLKNKNLTKEI